MRDNPATRSAGPWGWLTILICATAIVGIDQAAKYLIQTNLTPYQTVNPIHALSFLFNITYVTNTGAAFGLLPDRGLVFIAVAIVVSIGIMLYVRRIPHGEWLLKISLAMQLGGAMGNLLDRLRLGHVVDFADFHAWPVFNFADTFIVVGVILLAYRLLLVPDAPPEPAPVAVSRRDEPDDPSGD